MEPDKTIGYHERGRGETNVRHVVLNQIICEQNITDWSKGGILVLQNKQICIALSGNGHWIEVSFDFLFLYRIASASAIESIFCFRFVLNTDTVATAVKEFLQQYYAKIWMEYVVKNPLWMPGMPVTSDLFKQKSDQFIRQSALFTSKSVWNNWSVMWNSTISSNSDIDFKQKNGRDNETISTEIKLKMKESSEVLFTINRFNNLNNFLSIIVGSDFG